MRVTVNHDYICIHQQLKFLLCKTLLHVALLLYYVYVTRNIIYMYDYFHVEFRTQDQKPQAKKHCVCSPPSQGIARHVHALRLQQCRTQMQSIITNI